MLVVMRCGRRGARAAGATGRYEWVAACCCGSAFVLVATRQRNLRGAFMLVGVPAGVLRACLLT
jgi:hypothetical protein